MCRENDFGVRSGILLKGGPNLFGVRKTYLKIRQRILKKKGSRFEKAIGSFESLRIGASLGNEIRQVIVKCSVSCQGFSQTAKQRFKRIFKRTRSWKATLFFQPPKSRQSREEHESRDRKKEEKIASLKMIGGLL